MYETIAYDNALISERTSEANYNLSITERIINEGIFIGDKNIVYYLSDFLIEKEKQNILKIFYDLLLVLYTLSAFPFSLLTSLLTKILIVWLRLITVLGVMIRLSLSILE